ncbi:MAG: hypothetical protein VW270_15585, partial [Candidatus Poseidoniales archaeon]|jgi:hypothetical protein|tara:strand:+ start:1253 stop:1594 length:342 start_codon:yes stop_codon:yes gene_type:complete
MANTFKIATKSSLVTTAITDTATNILTAGASATHVLLSILVSNKTGTSADVDIYLVTDTGDDIYIIRNAPVPGGGSLEIISGSKIIMESSDVLRARADTATALDLSVSYLEQT